MPWISHVLAQHGHWCSRRASATASLRRSVGIEVATWRSGRIGRSSRSVILGNAKRFALAAPAGCRGGNRLPLGDQEAVGGDAERGVVVKASPAPALVIAKPKLLLEFTIVPLDPPAQFGDIDEIGERRGFGQRREPILGRLGLFVRPFDEQPFLGTRADALLVTIAPDARARPRSAIAAGRSFPPAK